MSRWYRCEARVWDFFHRVGADVEQYLDYVSGQNLRYLHLT
jgi:hypothetical protein